MLILLPLEVATGVLYKLTEKLITSFNIQSGEDAPDLLNVITDPLTDSIVQVETFKEAIYVLSNELHRVRFLCICTCLRSNCLILLKTRIMHHLILISRNKDLTNVMLYVLR